MTAQNWMIGDWYQWYAECRYYPYQVKPEDFTNDYIANFEPIPLTPEIMEKIGLRVVRKTEYTTKWEMCDTYDQWLVECTTREHPTGQAFLRIYIDYNPVVQMWVTDVHILQHALRLCELTDLANNLKLD